MSAAEQDASLHELPSASDVSGERELLAASLAGRLAGESSVSLRITQDSRLGRLVEIFGLSAFEADVVAVLWVTAFDASLRAEMLSRDRLSMQITPRSIAQLLGHPERVRLASESPLRLWRLVEEHPIIDGSAALAIDPHLIAWLEGTPELDRLLVGRARLLEPSFELLSWSLDRWGAQLSEGLRAGVRWRVRIDTEDTMLAMACATTLARRLGMPLLMIESRSTPAEEANERLLRAHRQAFFDGCALLLESAEAGIRVPNPFPLQFIVGRAASTASEDTRDLTLRLPIPTSEERKSLWRAALPSAAAWPQEQLDGLAMRALVGADEIARVAAADPRDLKSALTLVRQSSADDFGGLAQRIDASFGWDDLVVPEPVRERLMEISFEARERAQLWSEAGAARLYPQGRGLVALFAGSPGTGKTMAAQVIAAELELDLWRVDVSAVLSKWVGETAQHMQKILSSRTARRGVLFFDEADALYGKRVEEVKDAQDRFANLDISHLMVALEAYDGIVLMATNLRANIDSAFLRRIRHCVEFPRPDQHARRAIWQRVVPALFGGQALDANDLDRLALLDASGAQIKNAALSAVFAARRLQRAPDVQLLGRMLAREQAKDGIGLAQRELDAILGEAT